MNEKNLSPPVIYLENSDFKADGTLKTPPNVPCVIMIQSNSCGYCTIAKPDFQNFAEKYNKKVKCLSIEADSNPKGWHSLLPKIKPGFRGFPDYLLVGENKKQIGNNRSFQDLVEFANLK